MSTAFALLLRRHRIAARLSQEALADAAGVSTSAIGAYERGIHTAPHRHTIGLLAEALRHLRAELDRTIAVLSNGIRDVPTRQRTLEATSLGASICSKMPNGPCFGG
jgi:transcriptional regulator with XRE-family HTH domain